LAARAKGRSRTKSRSQPLADTGCSRKGGLWAALFLVRPKDIIAAGLSAFTPETAAIQAGRILLARIAELARQRQHFAFETTLASRSFAPFLRQLQRDGYSVHVIYIWLRTPELAVLRVSERVRQGGHAVPAEVVIRRYRRGLANFLKIYQALADSWIICDNSSVGSVAALVARGERGAPTEVLDQGTYDEITRAATKG
jgi:predicted ABC-type ATPase